MAIGGEPFPVDLLWVSKRRTREIVELHRATGPRVRVTGGEGGLPELPYTPSVKVDFERTSPSTTADYAAQATRNVASWTGTLQRPDRYIRMTLDFFHLAEFEVPFAWPDGTQQRVATLFASQFVEGIGRAFVALFGSPHNVIANMEGEQYLTGTVPSNANGLYRIINAMREPEEVQLLPETLTDPYYENDVDDTRRADLAAEVIYGLADPLPAQRLEVLAEVTSRVTNHTLSSSQHGEWPPRRFELVVIGTAIWAGTPAPRPDLAMRTALSDESARLWPLLDVTLHEFLESWRRHEHPPIPDLIANLDETQWRSYAAWFVNLGRKIADQEFEVVAHRRPSKWNPARHLSRRWKNTGQAPEPTSHSGFILPSGEKQHETLVTAEGDALPVCTFAGEVTYWPSGLDRWLGPGAAEQCQRRGEGSGPQDNVDASRRVDTSGALNPFEPHRFPPRKRPPSTAPGQGVSVHMSRATSAPRARIRIRGTCHRHGGLR